MQEMGKAMSTSTIRHLRRTLAWTTAAIVAVFTTATFAQNPFDRERNLNVYALTADQQLVRFRAEPLQRYRRVGPISGLRGSDTALIGIDFRVQDGKLYGVGNGGGIYTIDTETAQVTMVQQLTIALAGSSFGVDFNPAANALRIISDTGQNLRQPFAGATAGVTQNDTLLNLNGALAMGVTGAAYTNNDLDAVTATTLFDIDSVRNQVVVQSPANSGTLVSTGLLAVDPDSAIGFDIVTELKGGVAFDNTGYASLVVGGATGLYRVSILTGKATLVGEFPDAVMDIAIQLG
jgi:hypothetical protein